MNTIRIYLKKNMFKAGFYMNAVVGLLLNAAIYLCQYINKYLLVVEFNITWQNLDAMLDYKLIEAGR